jgi:hypothetical protein
MKLKNHGYNEFEVRFPFPCPADTDIHGIVLECYDRTTEECTIEKYTILVGEILKGSILDMEHKMIFIDPNEVQKVRETGICGTRFVSSRTHLVLLCPEHPNLDKSDTYIEDLLSC